MKVLLSLVETALRVPLAKAISAFLKESAASVSLNTIVTPEVSPTPICVFAIVIVASAEPTTFTSSLAEFKP